MEEVAPLAAEVVIGREAEERREEEEEEEGMREKGEEEMILCGCTIDKFSGMEMAGPKKLIKNIIILFNTPKVNKNGMLRRDMKH